VHSKLITYSADNQLSAPIAFVRNMFRDVMSARYVAYRLFLRDIKAKYRQTLLGYAWAFIPSIVVAYGLVEAAKAIVAKVEGDNAPALTVGDDVMQIDSSYLRLTELETLLGDPTKA
jgi:ABC-type polysaccharide/polyol phosphate export permease